MPQIVKQTARIDENVRPDKNSVPSSWLLFDPQQVTEPSSRLAQALLLAGKVNALRDGRFNVGFEDVQNAGFAALRHRVLLNFEADADGMTSDEVVKDVLSNVTETAKVAISLRLWMRFIGAPQKVFWR